MEYPHETLWFIGYFMVLYLIFIDRKYIKWINTGSSIVKRMPNKDLIIKTMTIGITIRYVKLFYADDLDERVKAITVLVLSFHR